jgi:hypothetical protein
MNKNKTASFRPWPDNAKRLDVAAKSGLNVSEMVNELIQTHFKSYVEQKAKKFAQLASYTN